MYNVHVPLAYVYTHLLVCLLLQWERSEHEGRVIQFYAKGNWRVRHSQRITPKHPVFSQQPISSSSVSFSIGLPLVPNQHDDHVSTGVLSGIL